MAVLGLAVADRMGVIIILAVAFRVVGVALWVMLPLEEAIMVLELFADDCVIGLGQNTMAVQDQLAGLQH